MKDLRSVCFAILVFALVTPAVSGAATKAETAGDVLQFLVPAAAFGATAYLHDGDGAMQLVKSYALSLGTTYLLKQIVPEKRPNGSKHSFPSGHTADVFTSAEFVRVRYGFKWGAPVYLVGVFVAYSRVESDQHHVQDVLAGAAIGIVSAHLFSRPRRNWNASVGMARNGVSFTFQSRF